MGGVLRAPANLPMWECGFNEAVGITIEIILQHGCSSVGLPRIFQSTCS